MDAMPSGMRETALCRGQPVRTHSNDYTAWTDVNGGQPPPQHCSSVETHRPNSSLHFILLHPLACSQVEGSSFTWQESCLLVLTPVLCIKPEPGTHPHAPAMPWGLPGDPPFPHITLYHFITWLQFFREGTGQSTCKRGTLPLLCWVAEKSQTKLNLKQTYDELKS